jgi:hypothetical protein
LDLRTVIHAEQMPPQDYGPGKSVADMLGEALREAGILVGVFGFLDDAFRVTPLSHIERIQWSGTVLVLTVVLISVGMVIERKRKR